MTIVHFINLRVTNVQEIMKSIVLPFMGNSRNYKIKIIHFRFKSNSFFFINYYSSYSLNLIPIQHMPKRGRPSAVSKALQVDAPKWKKTLSNSTKIAKKTKN